MKKHTLPDLNFVKNWNLVHSTFSDIETRKLTFIIENTYNGRHTKILDVFHYLPHGFCNKCETGFGATTAEMRASRNSIIVEPSRPTAWGKYQSHDEKKYGPKLFVGTPPGETKSTDPVEIRKFFNHHNMCTLPMKIFCVIDSLPKVINELLSKKYHNLRFHLLLDEQDALPRDAHYRPSMNIATDIYKSFPPEDRTAVSATFIQTSDPDLASEPLTVFRYERPEEREVELIESNSIISEAMKTLEDLLNGKPGEKIVVGISHFATIKDIIHYLTKVKKVIDPDYVKVLCAETSKNIAEEFYGRLENDLLPGTLNFITSAYFTGVDILEKYHAITLVDPNKKAFALSEKDLKQFMGRARMGLLSVKIIYNSKLKKPFEVHYKNDLISDAEEEAEDLNWIANRMLARKTVKQEAFENRSKFAEIVGKEGYPLVYVNASGKYKVSFNNIDAILEKYRLFTEVYSVGDGMKKSLEAMGCIVTANLGSSSIKTASSTNSLKFQVCGLLKKVIEESATTGKAISTDILKKLPTQLQSVGETFNEYLDKIESNSLGDIIADILMTKNGKLATFPAGISKKLDSVQTRLWFASLPKKNQLKAQVSTILKPGEVWNKEDLIEEMAEVWEKANIGTSRLGNRKEKNPKDYLKFVRRIFRVDDVKNHPEQIKLVDYHIDPTVVLPRNQTGKRRFFVGDYKEAS